VNQDPRDKKISELESRIFELERIIKEQDRIIKEQAETIKEQARVIEEWKRGHRVRGKRVRRKKKKSGQRRKPGRKAGHEGAQREIPTEVQEEEHHEKESCEHCNGILIPTGNKEEHISEDIIPARKKVTRHVVYEYYCPGCGCMHWSRLPPEYGGRPMRGQPVLGPGVLPFVASLRYDMGLSFYKIERYMSEHVGLDIKASGVCRKLQRAGEQTGYAYVEIQEMAKASLYNHMDETGWREDGIPKWAWITSNPELSLFHIDRSRGHRVIEKLLCGFDEGGEMVEPYEGAVISDFFSAYRCCAWMIHQYCWAHLIRDADKEAQMDPCRRTGEL